MTIPSDIVIIVMCALNIYPFNKSTLEKLYCNKKPMRTAANVITRLFPIEGIIEDTLVGVTIHSCSRCSRVIERERKREREHL